MVITYVEIDRATNKVRHIGHAPFVPDFGMAPIFARDVTGVDPVPAEGWIYDAESGAFTPPPEPVDELDCADADA